MIRFLTSGESHGKAEVAIIEGLPAGVPLTTSDINKKLKKRAYDFGRGGRGKIEKDEVQILSGVRFGKTLGSPIALLVENADFSNWQEKMSVEEQKTLDKETIRVTNPRPGHADLAGVLKYRFNDIRNVLERASARETVMRVAVGAVCSRFLEEFDIQIVSHTIRIGTVELENKTYTFSDVNNVYEKDSEIHCIDEKTREAMKKAILNARLTKNTLGGVVEIIAHNVPVGLGSYVHYDRKLDGQLAQALMSIPSVKAVEVGNAIEASRKTGKEVQDALFKDGKKIYRKTNNMGGLEGGVTNGEDIVCKVYHKPLSTLYDPLPTINIKTLQPSLATIERSDVCVVPRAGVISESMVAFVLAKNFLEKFGGDSLEEVKQNAAAYKKSLLISL